MTPLSQGENRVRVGRECRMLQSATTKGAGGLSSRPFRYTQTIMAIRP